jgi:hypothetical protein
VIRHSTTGWRIFLVGLVRMLSNAKKNADGSLYIQKDSLGADKTSNWLPAPNGPIHLVMRLYWPKETPPSVLPPGEGTGAGRGEVSI